jgi:hypothetical protein
MKIRLHYYATIYIVVIVVLLISKVLFVTTSFISEHIENQIAAKVNQFQLHVESNKNQKIESIIRNCKYIASDNAFISALENNDAEAIYSKIGASNNLLFGDVSLISDSSDNILAKSENLNGISNISELHMVSDLPGVKDSIRYVLINFWQIKEEHFIVCTVPVVKDSIYIGKLSIGSSIKGLFGQSISDDIYFALLNKSDVLFSRFEYDGITISDFVKTHRPIVDAILATSLPSDLFLTKIENNEVYSKIIPFGYGLPAYTLVSVLKSNEYSLLDMLVEYLLYVLTIGSLLLILIFYIFSKRYSRQLEILNIELQKLKETDDKDDLKSAETLKETKSKESEIEEEPKRSVLFSRIISIDDQNKENEVSFLERNNNYLKIQTELIELYEGTIEYVINNKILSSFNGADSIDKSLQCSLAIMKLINKESESSKFQIGIGINFGSIIYSGEKPNISGEVVELAESIANVTKPRQILINMDLISKTNYKYNVSDSKIWKFKNIKKDVKLVNILGEMKE